MVLTLFSFFATSGLVSTSPSAKVHDYRSVVGAGVKKGVLERMVRDMRSTLGGSHTAPDKWGMWPSSIGASVRGQWCYSIRVCELSGCENRGTVRTIQVLSSIATFSEVGQKEGIII